MKNKLLKVFLSASIYMYINFAFATELQISGILKRGDEKIIIEKIKSKNVTHVKLKNCNGGNAFAGIKIGEYINKNKINTSAEGMVASACAMIYLAGNKRNFVHNELATVLLIHGPRPIKGMEYLNKDANDGVEVYLQNILNLNMSERLIGLIKNTQNEYEGIYFIANKTGKSVAYCNAKTLEKAIKTCKAVPEITFESESIIKP